MERDAGTGIVTVDDVLDEDGGGVVHVGLSGGFGLFGVAIDEGLEDGLVLAVEVADVDREAAGEGAEADEVVLHRFKHVAEGAVAAVEGAEEVDLLAGVEAGDGVFDRFELTGEGVEFFGGDVGRGEAGCFAFEEAADGVEFADAVEVERGDEGALAGADLDEAFAFEAEDGFADGGAADLELGGDGVVRDGGAGREAVVEDFEFEGLVGAVRG